MADLLARLSKAIENREILKIAYMGGSRPGEARDIEPWELSDSDLIAMDLSSGTRKHYKLDKLRIIEHDDPVDKFALPDEVVKLNSVDSIQEVFDLKSTTFESLGFHVVSSPDSIAVFDFFKNGKVRKTPVAKLSFNPMTSDGFLTEEGFQVIERPNSRPFRIDIRGQAPKTFKELPSAASRFCELVAELAESRDG